MTTIDLGELEYCILTDDPGKLEIEQLREAARVYLKEKTAPASDEVAAAVLPCAVRVGVGTYHKGVKVSTLQAAIDRLHARYEAAQPAPIVVSVGVDELQKSVLIELEEFIPMDTRARKKTPTAKGAEIGIAICKAVSAIAKNYPQGVKIIPDKITADERGEG